ncbi:MAG TPA: sulfur carrier protein ThiS [Armatimonadota bacterium]|nr:sulfur carrier protein ThiS [Armatimonadota bacterium]HOS43593.1 sulfur carrier protein ThiS [Armatimonadota bacterium]
MQITINGQPTACPDGDTIADLLARLDVPPTGTAVARNDVVVRRALYAETALREGDRIEIIHAVAGG